MRTELAPALIAAKELPAPELPELIGSLAELQAICMARLAAPAIASRGAEDQLLTVSQAAERLGMSANYLYRHSESLPFVRRIGRALRFSSAGIDAYICRKDRRR